MVMPGRRVLAWLGVSLAMTATTCGPSSPRWQSVQQELPGAILSVWGTSSHDVYFAGSDALDGSGPELIHFDGTHWRRIPTGLARGDLWWVAGTGNDLYVVGTRGVVLHYDRSALTPERMTTPDDQTTLFGLWGTSSSNLWAVGVRVDTAGAVFPTLWQVENGRWIDRSATLPSTVSSVRLFKVWGTDPTNVWVVGENGTLLHFDGSRWAAVASGTTARLLTVNGAGALAVAVGGRGTAVVLENSGSGWLDVSPDAAPAMNGVFVVDADNAIAVGISGAVLRRRDGAWRADAEQVPTFLDLHSVWVDAEGGTWAVGGQIASAPFGQGVIYHDGAAVPTGAIEP